VERGLMRLDTSQHLPRLVFTESGLAALRTMMSDRRFVSAGLNPQLFADVGAPVCRCPD
jgi:hypothetical protein